MRGERLADFFLRFAPADFPRLLEGYLAPALAPYYVFDVRVLSRYAYSLPLLLVTSSSFSPSF